MEEASQKTEGQQIQGYSSVNLDEFIVPELEMAPAPRNRPWSIQEEMILRRYYGRVSIYKLGQYFQEHFPPGRTLSAIARKAGTMGLTHG